MLPTMNRAGDVLFVDKLTFKFRDVRRNEIVIAASPHKPGEEVCKRVIGLVSASLRQLKLHHISATFCSQAMSFTSADRTCV